AVSLNLPRSGSSNCHRDSCRVYSAPMFDRRQKINLAAALVCAAMFGYAIYAQKVLNYTPCPLCMFQRVCVVTLGIVFLIAALHPARRAGAIVYGVLIFLAAGATTWVAGRHVWIQHQPYGTVPSCGAPLDNLLEMFPMMEVVRRVLIMAVSLGLVGIVNNIVYPVRRA